MSLFLLATNPHLYPGHGLLSLGSPNGYVDTGVEMPVGGHVYLEEQVVHEAAILFGYLSPAEADTLRARTATLEERLADTEERLAALQNIERAVAALAPAPVAEVSDHEPEENEEWVAPDPDVPLGDLSRRDLCRLAKQLGILRPHFMPNEQLIAYIESERVPA